MARAKTRRNGPAPMGDDQFEAIDDVTRMYDTGPAGTIPANLRRDDSEPPYLVQRAGRSPTVSPAGRVMEHDFRTSTSERKGLGGRATVGKYGVQYLSMSKRSYSPITLEVMQRRYVRIDKDIEYLNRKGVMRSQSPQRMTPEDIANFLVYRQELGVTNSDLMHDIAALKGAFSIIGKTTVDDALAKFPYLRPENRDRNKIQTMDPRAFDRILENAAAVEVTDWRRMRAYAVVVFALATGMRAKELRLCDVVDIDDSKETWIAIVRHPKGENKWGRQRPVWVDPVAYPFLTRYLQARNDFVERNDLYTDALFPGAVDGGYLADNTIRTDKALVEEEIGYDFDLRMCRRTYGQRLIDRGIGINVVSKVLGHNSTNTTERYYCRLDDMDAVMTVAKALSAGLPGPRLPGESPDSSAGDRPQEFESINGVTDTDTECPPLGGE